MNAEAVATRDSAAKAYHTKYAIQAILSLRLHFRNAAVRLHLPLFAVILLIFDFFAPNALYFHSSRGTRYSARVLRVRKNAFIATPVYHVCIFTLAYGW